MTQDLNAQFNVPPLIEKPPVAPPKPKASTNPYKNERRVWIELGRDDKIPPTGQFFGYTADVLQNDGTYHMVSREFILKQGEKAWVPEGLINVLNDAVEQVAVKDSENRVVGYEPRLRFSYRVFANDPPPEGWIQPEVEPAREAA